MEYATFTTDINVLSDKIIIKIVLGIKCIFQSDYALSNIQCTRNISYLF
jgi:hypothetical protein